MEAIWWSFISIFFVGVAFGILLSYYWVKDRFIK